MPVPAVITSLRSGRTWRACPPPSSAARRLTLAAMKPSTTPTGCYMPTSTPNCTLLRQHSTASTHWFRIGLSLKRTGPYTLSRSAVSSRCSGARSDRGELGDQPDAFYPVQVQHHAARRQQGLWAVFGVGGLIDENQHHRRIGVQL